MKPLKVLLAFVLMLPLAGCWDQNELEEQAFVVVLGLDEGPNNTVDVTFQIANPQVGSSDKGAAEGEPSSDIVTFTSSDILTAKELANSVVTRTISFAHLKTMIVSEELARNPMFRHIVASAIRDPELRREVNIIVCREKAVKFIKSNKPELETRPHKYYQFMQQRWRDTGYVPFSTINRYLQRLSKDVLYLGIYATSEPTKEKISKIEDNYIAGDVPKSGGAPVQMMGSAVFREGAMIGYLTGEETRWTIFLRRNSHTDVFITTYPDPLKPDYGLSIRIFKNGDTSTKMNLHQDPPLIDVTLPVRVQVLSAPSLINYVTDLNNQRRLKAGLTEQITSSLEGVVKKMQTEFKAEPFLWHLTARTKFQTWKSYQEYDWSKHFTEAKVNITVKLTIENFGKQLVPPTIQNEE